MRVGAESLEVQSLSLPSMPSVRRQPRGVGGADLRTSKLGEDLLCNQMVGLGFETIAEVLLAEAVRRNFRDPLDIDVTLSSDAGGSARLDSDVPEGPPFHPEDW